MLCGGCLQYWSEGDECGTGSREVHGPTACLLVCLLSLPHVGMPEAEVDVLFTKPAPGHGRGDHSDQVTGDHKLPRHPSANDSSTGSYSSSYAVVTEQFCLGKIVAQDGKTSRQSLYTCDPMLTSNRSFSRRPLPPAQGSLFSPGSSVKCNGRELRHSWHPSLSSPTPLLNTPQSSRTMFDSYTNPWTSSIWS